MLVKVILLFLLAMALVGMVGKLLFPGRMPWLARKTACPRCGKPQIGRKPCDCGGRA